MDKELLFDYFQKHYLSRREVVYKLPLNIPIGEFWPELQKRRKANAVILPLLNGKGQHYWYVLTNKMVAASELLIEESMKQEDETDPYRVQMTSAMTEEIFFTSFVEGAQISLQEAMEYLEQGREPENVQEQMIENNRQAWTVLTQSLYQPLDKNYIKSMAMLLTDGMDNAAVDYRLTDHHPIVAMGNEYYEVPSCITIPDRMEDYYAFLASPEVHPLIKAAVGQAYLLVARPFPEGNERLSRMVSQAVLLRSGYGYFRDISLSGSIARESYKYYKSMCEILRSENGGDLTYFVEYFLELLIHALRQKKERDEQKMRESLELEREMAKQPLDKVSFQREESVNDEKTNIVTEEKINAVPEENAMENETPETSKEEDYWGFSGLTTLEAAEKLLANQSTSRLGTGIKKLISQNVQEFTLREFMRICKTSEYFSKKDIRFGVLYGCFDVKPRNGNNAEKYWIIPKHPKPMAQKELLFDTEKDALLEIYTKYKKRDFMPPRNTHLSYLVDNNEAVYLEIKALNKTMKGFQRIFRLNVDPMSAPEYFYKAKENGKADEYDAFADYCKTNHIQEFNYNFVSTAMGYDKTQSSLFLLRGCISDRFIKTEYRNAYTINPKPNFIQRLQSDKASQDFLKQLYQLYGTGGFTKKGAIEHMSAAKRYTDCFIDALYDAGILHRKKERAILLYYFWETPQTNPELFGMSKESSVVTPLPHETFMERKAQ